MDNPAFVVEYEQKITIEKMSYPHGTIAHTFEEAVTLTKVGKFHYLLMLVCGFCFMSVMCEIMGVSLIMPSMKCDLPSTVTEQGMLASAGFLGVVLSSHIMGFLADTWGRVRTLRYAFILSTISSLISGFSVNIWMLIVFRFLCGFFISGGQACVFSLCGEHHGAKTRVRHVTLLAGFMPLAFIYLPAMASVILPIQIDAYIFGMKFSSWRVLLMSNAMVSIVALIGLMTLSETPKYVLVQGDHDLCLEILRKMYVKNNGGSADEYPVKRIVLQTAGASLSNIHGFKDAVKMVWSQTVPLFYKERCLHTINICVSLFVIYGISQGIFMWFPTILNELLAKNGENLKVCQILSNLDPSAGNAADVCNGDLDLFMFYVMMMIGGAFAIIFLIFAFAIDYVGKKNLVLFWLCISLICSVAIHWTSVLYLSVIFITLIMSVGNCGGIIGTISMEFYPTNINAMGMCFIMMVGRLGAVAGSNLIGPFLFNQCDTGFWILFGVMSMLLVSCSLLPEKKSKKVKKQVSSS